MAARFRIISANLWNGRADAIAFAELVVELDADAVAVQELGPAQADALGRVRPHGLLEPALDFSGMGIALRAPAAMRRLPLPCRDARIADIQVAGGHGFELINLHVQAPHSPPTWGTVTRRRGQWHGIERHLAAAPQQPRVLVGDFNATPLWPLYRRLTAQLRDAAVVAAKRDGGSAARTWGPWPAAPRLLRIDHAFVHRVEVLACRVVPVHGGDHSAVVVDIAVA
jgi:endonuclease/exonuclease/phosphatase family metal-dependent hydrolase